MNNNIFSYKGKIGQSSFVINYIILTIMYFMTGFFLFPVAYKFNWPLAYMNCILGVINLFIMFNYKKRIMHISNNIILSIILAFILTLDHLFLAFLNIIEWKYIEIIFYILLFVVFIVQPAIVALLSGKKTEG